MITLAIDASTYVGTVAVLDDDRVVGERSVTMRGEAEERLMPAVTECLRSCGWPALPVDRVVCGEGPGSFTSLRIAGAIAKGLAESLGVPLLSVPSLALIVTGQPHVAAGRYLAALDAMRGESFVARIETDAAGRLSRVDDVVRVPTSELVTLADGATLTGPASGVHASPHARGVGRMIGTRWLREANLDHWEPDYGRLAEAQVKWEAAHGRPLPEQGRAS
jgi:tRNA threonylcarbamoyladenosine biosynthesis protein TsaB